MFLSTTHVDCWHVRGILQIPIQRSYEIFRQLKIKSVFSYPMRLLVRLRQSCDKSEENLYPDFWEATTLWSQ